MALDWLSVARVGSALAFLCIASWQDFKTRLVEDFLWMAMGVVGLVFLVGEMIHMEVPSNQYLLLFPIILLFYDPYIDREPLYEKGEACWPAIGGFVLAGVVAAIAIYLGGLTRLLVIPTMFLLIYLLYFSNVIHGGADAKALMAICLLVPWYPHLPGLPLASIPSNISSDLVDISFPFVLLVLMMGSAVVLLLPLYNLAVNAARRDLAFPMCLFGRRIPVAEAEKSLVWPMERLADAKLVRVIFPKRGRNLKKDYEDLKAAGIEKVWVTPKIPFIVPLTIGLALATVLGNVVFWLGEKLAG